MGRPRARVHDENASVTVTLKLTRTERDRLQRLVEARSAELRTMTGQRLVVTVSSYLRWLMDRDAESRGIGLAGTESVEDLPTVALPHIRIPLPTRSQRGFTQEQVRALLVNAIESGHVTGSAVAQQFGLQTSAVTRFRSGKQPWPGRLEALAEFLRGG